MLVALSVLPANSPITPLNACQRQGFYHQAQQGAAGTPQASGGAFGMGPFAPGMSPAECMAAVAVAHAAHSPMCYTFQLPRLGMQIVTPQAADIFGQSPAHFRMPGQGHGLTPGGPVRMPQQVPMMHGTPMMPPLSPLLVAGGSGGCIPSPQLGPGGGCMPSPQLGPVPQPPYYSLC